MQKKNEKRALVAEMLRRGASTRTIVSEAKVSFNLVAAVRRELNQAGEQATGSAIDSVPDSATQNTTDSATNSGADSSMAAPKQLSEQSYLLAVCKCISGSAAELLLFRQKRVDRDGLIALTRNLADCMNNFTQYLALKGTLETPYPRRVNKLLDLLRRALADSPPFINHDIYETAKALAEAPMVNISDEVPYTSTDLTEVFAYRPPVSTLKLKEVFHSEKIRLAIAKLEAFNIRKVG